MSIKTLFQSIADAIRQRAEVSDTWTPAEMPAAILAIPGGGNGWVPIYPREYNSTRNIVYPWDTEPTADDNDSAIIFHHRIAARGGWEGTSYWLAGVNVGTTYDITYTVTFHNTTFSNDRGGMAFGDGSMTNYDYGSGSGRTLDWEYQHVNDTPQTYTYRYTPVSGTKKTMLICYGCVKDNTSGYCDIKIQCKKVTT